MGSHVYDSNIHTDQEAQIKLGDLTLRQAFTISQTGYLNITQIGDDEATPVDTLAIYCNTTVASASNRRTWTQYGGDISYYMAAAATFLIDGTSVAHTTTNGLLDINLTTATSDGVNAVNILVTTHDLADGEWAMGLRATVDATAAVTATSNSAAIYLDTPTDPGATNVTYGIYIETGWDFGLASLSPVMLSSLTLAPAADPTPYPLDFQLEGWGVAGTGMAGIYTQGRVINMEYGAARTLDGALYGMYIDFNTLVTHGSQQITVFNVLLDATDYDYDTNNTASLINANLDNTIGPHIRMDVIHTQDSSIDLLLGSAITVATNETWRGMRISDNGNALTVGVGETGYGLMIDFDTLGAVGGTWAALRIETPAGTDAISIGDGSINWIPGAADTFVIAPTAASLTIIDFVLETEFTQGTLFNADYAAGPTVLAGALIYSNINFTTNVTPGANQIEIMEIAVGATTYDYDANSDAALINANLDNTIGPHMRWDVVHTQDSSFDILLGAATTVAANETWRAFRFSDGGNALTIGAGETAHGLELDFVTAAVASDATAHLFGILVTLPVAFSAAGDYAAFRATGNANTVELLNGDGMYVQMREATSNAINLDIDQAADTANDQIGIAITKDMSNTSGAGVSMTNSVIDITVALTNSVALSTVDWNDYFIDLDYTASQADATNTFTGGFISMLTTESVGTLTIYGDMVSLTVAGTVDTGQTMRGYYLNADGITAGAGETFYGIDIDMSTTTVGGTVAAINIAVPAGTDAISTNGSINWIPSTGDTFIIAPTVAALTLFDFVLETEFTGGTLINADFAAGPTTLTGVLQGINLEFSSNVTPADNQIIGVRVTLPDNVSTATVGYDLLSTQDQGIGIHIDFDSTVGAGLTLEGISIDADTSVVGVGESFYGINLNMDAMTTGGTVFGIFIQLSPGSRGMNMDASTGNDVANDIVGTRITKNLTITAAGDVAMTNPVIDINATLTNAGGGKATWDDYYLDLDYTASQADDTNTWSGGFISMVTTESVGTLTIYGDMVSLTVAGTVDAGQTLRGYYLNADGITAGAGEAFYGIDIDMSTTTVGGFVAAINIAVPAGTDAISTNGSINWIPGAADTFVIAPTAASLTLIDFVLETEFTGGTLINADYGGATTLAGALTGATFDFTTNITDAADQNVVGYYVSLPLNVGAASYGMHILTIQDQGTGIFMDINSTVGAGQTLKGIHIDADGAVAGAGETFYGIHIDASALTTGGTIAGIYVEVPTGEDALLVSNGTISIGGAYNQGILFTEDPVAGNVINSFINIGNYTTAIAVAPTSANMFGVMHNVSLTDVDVAFWYQAYYTKITTAGTTTATSVAGHAYRIEIGSDLEAVYGIQCHTNINATNACNQEIISVSALVDLGTGTATTTDRVCAFQAMFSGAGAAGTVVGDAFVAYIVNAGTVVTTDAILKAFNQSAATTVEGIHIENDGTMTNAIRIDNDGTLTNGIVFEGTITTGIDLSGATTTTALDTGAGLVDIGGNMDMTGGASSWFRTPQMTTAERNAMTGAWGAGDQGKQWYNTTTDQWEGWDGTAIVIIG